MFADMMKKIYVLNWTKNTTCCMYFENEIAPTTNSKISYIILCGGE